MTGTSQTELTRVVSADGTGIAVHVSGQGRPLVLVHGTTSDHTAWRFVTSHLEQEVAVHAVDRRGRGDSGDTAPYSLDKECADVAAVVDAAAASFGSAVDLFGHSFGGNVAFGAALLTGNVRRLVLYEGWPPPNPAHRTPPPEVMGRLEALLTDGRPETMLETFYREVVLMTEDEIRAVRSSPSWPARVAAARTVPREIEAFGGHAFDPSSAARIDVPVLLLVGGDSPDPTRADPEAVAAALPDTRIHILPGQAHQAHLASPEAFADELLAFVADR